MKKRIITIILAFVMSLVFTPMFEHDNYAYAAGNPYPQYNYYNSASDYQIACTWYAWKQANERLGLNLPSWGNAGSWYGNAGYSKGSAAQANSIACWSYQNSPSYGHVAYVTGVNADGSINIVEGGSNWSGNNHGICSRTVRPGQYWPDQGFIYLSSGTNHNPVGAFDVVQDKCGAIFVRGWAFDPDDKSRQIDVHVYIGADSTAGGGEGHAIKANTYRNDVNKVYGCGDNHGFDAVIETQKTGTQTVYVFAINIGDGGNQLIGTQTVNISNPLPVGNIDSIVGGEGCIKVGGWAFDPSDTSKPVAVHVYIGSSAGSSNAENHIITADVERKDVNKAYGCGDYHGFSATIPTDKTGSQPVYIYAINIGTGWVNTYLGTKTVTISKHSHNLTKTPAKAATTSSEGNIEYWTCSGCGKIFKDAAGQTEITKAQTVIPKLTPSTPTNPTDPGNPSTPTNPTDPGDPSTPTNPSITPGAQENVKTDLPAVKISKTKAAKKAVTVKWKKVTKKNQKKIQGIEIQVASDAGFTQIVKSTTASKKKTSKKLKGLKSKQTYWVRIRAYKKAADGKHVSAWKVKKVKVK